MSDEPNAHTTSLIAALCAFGAADVQEGGHTWGAPMAGHAMHHHRGGDFAKLTKTCNMYAQQA